MKRLTKSLAILAGVWLVSSATTIAVGTYLYHQGNTNRKKADS